MNLCLSDPMMSGLAVKRLQEALAFIGFYIEKVDGIFGPNTKEAVLAFQKNEALVMDGIVGPITWNRIEKVISTGRKPDGILMTNYPGKVIDLLQNVKHPKLYSEERSPRKFIEGVTIHQTGCKMSDDPYAWKSLNAHIGVLRSGYIVFVHSFTDFIWHAQGLSHSTIGIEIEGNFCGIDGDMTTLWKPGGGPHRLTEPQKDAIKKLFPMLWGWFKDSGFKWETIHAHRQSSSSRTADPGSEIWQFIRTNWLVQGEWKFDDGGPNWCIGTGKPIPRQWWPEYMREYK